MTTPMEFHSISTLLTSTLSSGLSLFSTFLHFFRDANLFLFIFVGFVMQLDESLIVGIEVVDDPDDGAFTVMAFNANHCPGNQLFFFVLMILMPQNLLLSKKILSTFGYIDVVLHVDKTIS